MTDPISGRAPPLDGSAGDSEGARTATQYSQTDNSASGHALPAARAWARAAYSSRAVKVPLFMFDKHKTRCNFSGRKPKPPPPPAPTYPVNSPPHAAKSSAEHNHPARRHAGAPPLRARRTSFPTEGFVVSCGSTTALCAPHKLPHRRIRHAMRAHHRSARAKPRRARVTVVEFDRDR